MLDWPRRRPASRIRGRGGWLGTKVVSRRTRLGAPGGAPVAGCCVQHTCEAPCGKRVAQWVADALPTKAGSAAELCPVGMSTPPRGRGPRGLRGGSPREARGEPCAAGPRGLESPMEPADAREPNRSRAGGGTRSPPPRHGTRRRTFSAGPASALVCADASICDKSFSRVTTKYAGSEAQKRPSHRAGRRGCRVGGGGFCWGFCSPRGGVLSAAACEDCRPPCAGARRQSSSGLSLSLSARAAPRRGGGERERVFFFFFEEGE